MTDDGLTETQRAFLQSQYHREAFEDMSAADINRLDMATFARLTGREFGVIEPAEPPGRPREAHPGQDPQAVVEAQHPAHSVEHPGIDFSRLSMSEYERVREQLGIGRSPSARGIFGN